MCGAVVGVSGAADEPARKKARGDANSGLCWRWSMKVQGTGNNGQGTGLRLVKKPVASVDVDVLREGSTGRVVRMVPRIWAVAETLAPAPLAPTHDDETVMNGAPEGQGGPEVAFYRKYTEAMLRRYMRLSMEAGRVPSLLGREMFRGQVTSYKVKSFEDVVIFCYDVEKCLKVLDAQEKELIRRIALQAYSQGEAAGMLGISLRSCVMQYARALDKLTRVLLRAQLLKPLESCQ